MRDDSCHINHGLLCVENSACCNHFAMCFVICELWLWDIVAHFWKDSDIFPWTTLDGLGLHMVYFTQVFLVHVQAAASAVGATFSQNHINHQDWLLVMAALVTIPAMTVASAKEKVGGGEGEKNPEIKQLLSSPESFRKETYCAACLIPCMSYWWCMMKRRFVIMLCVCSVF